MWTGEQALKIGLVDRLGNINDAIKCAANKANIKGYQIETLPEQKSILDKLGLGLNAQIKARMLKSELGENYKYYEQVKAATQMSGILARMPYDVSIN